jgi:hypothetical protein
MTVGGGAASAVERALAAVLVTLACGACAVAVPSPDEPQGLVGTSSPPAVSETSPAPPPSAAPSGSAGATARSGTALAVLGQLAVKGRAPRTGYSRAQFGGRWPDVDRNGCDTRNDVLQRDLTGIRLRAGSGCVVTSGRLLDPYTGSAIRFVRGAATSSAVQIDHVVALGDAWQKGAQRWSAATRERFANDPLELLAVGGAVNQRKGDGDAATWLPPRTAYRCAYVARQVAVKARYGLWVTAAERDAMAQVLTRCPSQPLPTG